MQILSISLSNNRRIHEYFNGRLPSLKRLLTFHSFIFYIFNFKIVYIETLTSEAINKYKNKSFSTFPSLLKSCTHCGPRRRNTWQKNKEKSFAKHINRIRFAAKSKLMCRRKKTCNKNSKKRENKKHV